ncbi:hypothetical protein [Pendulispora albinea]|uniref:Uncharacterized protein n=1 Tax=Pendulispora albinea TaxID=2741071 RepID=A0ABZ2LTW2_9BACT
MEIREANGAAEVESSLRKIASKISPDKISSFARELPEIVEREVKANPYRTLGVAAGIGFGVGAIVGSRLLRTVLLATGGVLASEMARGHVRRFIEVLVDEVDNESNNGTSHERA